MPLVQRLLQQVRHCTAASVRWRAAFGPFGAWLCAMVCYDLEMHALLLLFLPCVYCFRTPCAGGVAGGAADQEGRGGAGVAGELGACCRHQPLQRHMHAPMHHSERLRLLCESALQVKALDRTNSESAKLYSTSALVGLCGTCLW